MLKEWKVKAHKYFTQFLCRSRGEDLSKCSKKIDLGMFLIGFFGILVIGGCPASSPALYGAIKGKCYWNTT